MPEVLLPQNYQPPKDLAPPPGTIIGPDGNLVAVGPPLINPIPNLTDPNPPLAPGITPSPPVPGSANPDNPSPGAPAPGSPPPDAPWVAPVAPKAPWIPQSSYRGSFGGNVGPVGSQYERNMLSVITGQPATEATELLLGPVARGTTVSLKPGTEIATRRAEMRFRAPLIGLTLFMVVALTLTWLVYVSLRRDVAGDTAKYSAVFTDVYGLREGDDVRMAGVRVGRVENVELDGKLAKVAFVVQTDQHLYGNTVASVTYQNIVGQRYLGLSLGPEGSQEPLPPGSVLPLARTEPSFDVTALLNGYEPLFSLLNPQDADNLTKGIIASLQGDTSSLTMLISQTSTLTETFAGRDQALGAVITNLNKVRRQPCSAERQSRRGHHPNPSGGWPTRPAASGAGLLGGFAVPGDGSAFGLGHRRVPRAARIRRPQTRCRQTPDGCRAAGGVLRRQHPAAAERACPSRQPGRLRQRLRVRRELHGVLPRPQRCRADHRRRRHPGKQGVAHPEMQEHGRWLTRPCGSG